MLKIVESILTKNPCYTGGRKLTKVKGLTLHSVGCPQPSAMVFVNNWNKESYDRACVHAFIDGNTGVVYQCLPWNHRGWHGGSGTNGSVNNTHIGVEMCEPACIKYTGGSSFTCSDVETAKAVVKRTYDSAVELFAFLCKEYDLDPLADGVIISHKEGHARKIASNHGDPEHLWNQLGMGYTMDTFRQAVKAAMNGTVDVEPNAPVDEEEEEKSVLYRVQVGAYSVKKNAETQLAKVKAAGFKDAIINVNEEDSVSTVTPTPVIPVKTNEELATEVIAGKWGNGADRKKALTEAGYDYDAVQTIVDQKLGKKPTVKVDPTPATPAKKSVEEIAKEVLAGKWGNGTDRKKKLEAAGYNYTEVQNKVNELSGKKTTTTTKKSVIEIAKEVIAGKWGNGADRKKKLEAAGYNYSEVQKKVNELL